MEDEIELKEKKEIGFLLEFDYIRMAPFQQTEMKLVYAYSYNEACEKLREHLEFLKCSVKEIRNLTI